MTRPSFVHSAAALFCLAAAQAQDEAQQKIHPHLQELLRAAAPQQALPVYFVLRERLGYEHWFPRVWSLPLQERRALVVRELQQHAARTQAELLEYLHAEERAGNVTDVRSNWLGNFVLAKATPVAILTAASDPSVAEVWSDHVPPRHEVEDVDPAAPATYGPPPPPRTSAGPRTAGNGPLAVFADRVWALGFQGQGVVVMNADSGIDTVPAFHSDLAANVWRNLGEIPGNGIDDDNNGFVDDVHGWNFGTNSANLDDGGGHGTNTAGCIVADGTCNGITYGMAPLAKVMTGALGGESSQWGAIQYALQMGADLQTSSHSYKSYMSPPPNYKMHRDIGVNTLAAGLIRTNSTSNDGASCGSTTNAARKPINISVPGNLPPPYLDPNQTLRGQLGGVLGVAAWNFTNNTLMSYSPCGPFAWNLPDLQVNVPSYPTANWDAAHNDYPWTGGTQLGLLKPDVSSPTGTRTTASSPCSFTTFSGTSNATPNVIGVIALWKSANPSLTPEDIAMIVHTTSSDRGTIPGKENNWGAGVIDAEQGLYRALCVHRVDHQPQWEVAHSIAAGDAHFALDGVPNSLGAIAIGLSRTPVNFGVVTVGLGPVFETAVAGLTDGNGDLATTLPTVPGLLGLSFYSQAFVWDQTHTQRILASNVVGIRITP